MASQRPQDIPFNLPCRSSKKIIHRAVETSRSRLIQWPSRNIHQLLTVFVFSWCTWLASRFLIPSWKLGFMKTRKASKTPTKTRLNTKPFPISEASTICFCNNKSIQVDIADSYSMPTKIGQINFYDVKLRPKSIKRGMIVRQKCFYCWLVEFYPPDHREGPRKREGKKFQHWMCSCVRALKLGKTL